MTPRITVSNAHAVLFPSLGYRSSILQPYLAAALWPAVQVQSACWAPWRRSGHHLQNPQVPRHNFMMHICEGEAPESLTLFSVGASALRVSATLHVLQPGPVKANIQADSRSLGSLPGAPKQ